MIANLMKSVFGSANDRLIKALDRPVQEINDLEPQFEKLTDTELQAKTDEFRQRLASGETLDDILPEAFATVREGSRRVLGERHYDVQLKGGIILHRGMIAEMKTGEGKTLVATLPVYLNALEGKGVHVVTVNDYLAARDAEWMGRIYTFLGLTVGCITSQLDDLQRQDAYACDITHGTNNEFGFDYLRDNMKFSLIEMVQRPFNFAIVDEVDSILVDEARTPLIISGPAEDSSELYVQMDQIIPQLGEDDYEKDEKARSVTLTEKGTEHVEDLLRKVGMLGDTTVYDVQNVSLVHHVNQALKAYKIFQRDVDYMVKDNKIMIIDEFTGRLMEGRRYSEGLHQALEAKEGVEIQKENQTLASVTYQNYFRLYPKLAGMTGTAMTEAAEFGDIYKLEVVEMPTNKPVSRLDEDDEVYRTAQEKYDAIIKEIQECQERKQPILVGTVSIEKSEMLSQMLKNKKITHNVLNAKHHEKEAVIIAEAGVPGTVTIATNMAGRGTDIKLGGNVDMRIEDELADVKDAKTREKLAKEIATEVAANADIAKEAGGLYVLGTERHESRRIDNQLRGRAGRQGDKGRSKFYLSLEDDLMRIFAGTERLDSWLQKLGLEEGEAIIHPWINKALEKAQQKVEARNYDVRKHLLKYDDVMNDQRKVIYEQRREIMEDADISDIIQDMREELITGLVSRFIPEKAYAEKWDIHALHEECMRLFNLDLPLKEWADEEGIADAEILERVTQSVCARMEAKEKKYGPELMRMAEKSLLLQILDQNWKDHLLSLDHLRQGINLRAYGQRDPLNEYKGEAFEMFQDMLNRLRENIISVMSFLEIGTPNPEEVMEQMLEESADQEMTLNYTEDAYNPGEDLPKATARAGGGSVAQVAAPVYGDEDEVPRNAPCPCGSGKRYKQCCGKV